MTLEYYFKPIGHNVARRRHRTLAHEENRPDRSRDTPPIIYGSAVALTFVDILKRCGEDLSRPNLMRQVTSFNGVSNPMLLPGVKRSTSATDYRPSNGCR